MAKTGKIYYSKIEFTDEYVAEHYTFPVMFFITDNIEKIKKQITYDVTGKKSVAYFSESQEPDHILTLGPVTPTTNTLNVSVHLSGVNSVRISGVIWSKSTPDTFLFTPVTAGKLKYIILYALADSQIFYIAEGTEGTEAIFPDIPADSLFVKSILISEFGALVEDSDDGYKLLAEDPWRNIIINNNSIVVIAGSPSSSFNLLVGSGSTDPKIGGIRTKVQKNTRDGHEITFYNDSPTAITFIAGEYSETTAATSFGFKTEFVLSPGKFQKFKRKNNLYEVLPSGSDPDLSPYALDADLDAEIVNRALADALKLDKPTAPNNVPERVILGDGSTKPISEIGSLPSGGNDDEVLIKSGTTGIWSSIIKGVEFLGNAWLKLKLISFQGYTILQRDDLGVVPEGTQIYVNDGNKGMQVYINGSWSSFLAPTQVSTIYSPSSVISINRDSTAELTDIPTLFLNALIGQDLSWFIPNVGSVAGYNLLRAAVPVMQGQVGRTDTRASCVLYSSNGANLGFARGSSLYFSPNIERTTTVRKFSVISNVSTQRVLVGVSMLYSGTAPTNVDLSTLTNIIGVCFKENDSKLYYIWNDATGSANFQDTGFVHDTAKMFTVRLKNISSTVLRIIVSSVDKFTFMQSSVYFDINEFTSAAHNPIIWGIDSLNTGTVQVLDYGGFLFAEGGVS